MRRLTLIAMILLMVVSNEAWAQATDSAPRGALASGPRRQLATIVFAGLGGAILGLSTLSFYGRPQDRLANIAIGAAIGVISGAVYVTYQAAANPRDFYGERLQTEFERQLALGSMAPSLINQAPQTVSVEWTF